MTLVDRHEKLLKNHPKTWDEIKGGRFMIINSQHSISASKELQKAEWKEERRLELETWEAYSEWTLDLVQLHNISKFYNSTNHLNHAQPTWKNQMISCTNIWKHCGRPSCSESKATTDNNGAVNNPTKYLVNIQLSSTQG